MCLQNNNNNLLMVLKLNVNYDKIFGALNFLCNILGSQNSVFIIICRFSFLVSLLTYNYVYVHYVFCIMSKFNITLNRFVCFSFFFNSINQSKFSDIVLNSILYQFLCCRFFSIFIGFALCI